MLSLLTTDQPVGNPKAWLVAAVCNASRQYWRERIRHEARDASHEVETPLSESLMLDDLYVERLERTILIRRVLGKLLPADREILRMHYFEGETAAEIAMTLGTSAGYAEKLIHRALRQARRTFECLRSEAAYAPTNRVLEVLRTHGISAAQFQGESRLLGPQMDVIVNGGEIGSGAKVRIVATIRRMTGEPIQMADLFTPSASRQA